jgi:hypothetical protein
MEANMIFSDEEAFYIRISSRDVSPARADVACVITGIACSDELEDVAKLLARPCCFSSECAEELPENALPFCTSTLAWTP